MDRPQFRQAIEQHFKVHSVCALLGPRQCGKTTLANQFARDHDIPPINRFDLEDPRDEARLEEPMLALEDLKGVVIIDEIQIKANLFSVLRVLVDRNPVKFLILGSASQELLKQSSESLAGRIGYIEMTPFQLTETKTIPTLWNRGGFPRSYLANTAAESILWRQSYIKTFLERDIPNLGFAIPAQQLRRFWLMLCHYHGQILNTTELGTSFGISAHTVRKYIHILEGTFMIRVLAPWHENLKKRQVKQPKIYFRDSGIYHALLGLNDTEALTLSPKIGASWEGFALEEIIRLYKVTPEECYFWATHNVSEIDLLIIKNGKRLGFEFKYTKAPKITKSLEIVQENLKLDRCYIVYPGSLSFPVSKTVQAIGLEQFTQQVDLLGAALQ